MVWAVTRESDEARLAAKVLLAPVEDAIVEVGILERLEHDHVLRVHDTVLEMSGPQTRLVMITDLAEGGSLGSAITGRGHLTVGEMVTVLTPVARTLHDLHGQGLVHGDLSPANVLLDTDGKPLLADFGVSRLAADGDAEVWGSEGYVAPEVLAGAPPTPAADVYALGALAWTALVGEAPPPAALRPHLPDVAPQAPAVVCDLVLSCLAHTPEARPDAGAVALAIWDCAAPEPAPRAGSEGARTRRVDDPWSGLTQRIRETAREPEPEPERSWHRTSAARRVLVAAGVAGVVAGAVVVWPETADVHEQALAAHPPEQPSATQTSEKVATVPPREERTRAARKGAGTVAPSMSQPAPATKTTSPSPIEQLRRDPDRVLQQLVDARARAWTDGTDYLAHAMVVDSAAYRRDRADLSVAERAGARYAGIDFTVRDVRVRSGDDDHATVEAVVDRSAYRVVGSSTVQAPARPGQRVTLTLDHTRGGWRIANWTAV